jgi:hypothetical protein
LASPFRRRNALAQGPPDPYVAGADVACDGTKAQGLQPALPFPSTLLSPRGFARSGAAFLFSKTKEAAGRPSQGQSMNTNHQRPNRRPKLFLPLFLANANTVREPKPFSLSPDQLRAAVAERIG